jgi:hypothetical protein
MEMMMTRRNYMMTQAQYDAIIEACKPTPLIGLQWGMPRSQQERANDAWDALGKEMGFIGRSVAPGEDGKLSFTAEPTP